MKPRHAPLRFGVALAVLATHLALLLWWLHGDSLQRSAPTAPARVAVRLIAPALRVPPPPPREAAPPVRAAETRRPAAAPARRADEPPSEAPRAPQAITAAPEVQPRASEVLAEPRPSLMDGEATRRAIRAAAREPGLAAQAGRQGAPLQTPDERLGERVHKSAKGDCLKGEYFGGGAGLLSLPFLAAAALTDQCRR